MKTNIKISLVNFTFIEKVGRYEFIEKRRVTDEG